MQEAAKSSTAFGRIRSFESLVGSLDEQPGHVKPMAKKLPKKSKGAVCKRPASKEPAQPGLEAAPCKRPASKEAPAGAINKRPAGQGPFKFSWRSRLYSAAYHRAKAEAVNSGKGPEEAGKAARLSAQAKVAEAEAEAAAATTAEAEAEGEAEAEFVLV